MFLSESSKRTMFLFFSDGLTRFLMFSMCMFFPTVFWLMSLFSGFQASICASVERKADFEEIAYVRTST